MKSQINVKLIDNMCEICLHVFLVVRGAATLKARTLKEVWTISAVIPVDRELKESKSYEMSSGYNEQLLTENK